ncbi:YdcF family protein [Acinetobacter sp. UBA6720]|uniref:YdcF family protein n=1 Tax=Acinetobacter sp. UBA6720 TaxID=1945953 RepID=UPI0025C1315D|nr:YdcF family protein [Acinetobacter sp. UBA6720]
MQSLNSQAYMQKSKRIISFVIGSLLFANGLYFILKLRFDFGILLPLFIGLGLLIYALTAPRLRAYIQTNKIRQSIWRYTWAIFLLWICSLAIFFLFLKFSNEQNIPHVNAPAVLVLGSGLKHGKPSPTLASRLDQAAHYVKQYPETIIVVSGGLSPQQNISEANAMRQYLVDQHHIPAHRIYTEEQSTSTELNLFNSKKILAQQHISIEQPIAIVTSDFHIPRSRAIAIRQGYQSPIMIGAKTPLETRYNAWLREYFAFISGWLLNEY